MEFGEADIKYSWAYENKYILLGVAVIVALAGIALSVGVYSKKKLPIIEPAVLAQGWRYDQGITAFMGGPGRKAFEGVAWADRRIVDGAVNGVGSVVNKTGGFIRLVQTGAVRTYAAGITVGVLALLIWFFIQGVVL